MTRILGAWNSFWHGDSLSETGAEIFRIYFYASFFFILLSDHYGTFFLNLAAVVPELRQPTPLEPVFGVFPVSREFFRAVWLAFLASCALSSVGALGRFSKVLAAISGLYILNTVNSFGNWHHPSGIPAVTLVFMCFFPSSYRYSADHYLGLADKRRPEIWLFKMLQVLVVWSYFSSGIYKLVGDGFGFKWASANSFYNYVLTAGHLEKMTDNKWLITVLAGQEHLCLLLGWAAMLIELFCPIALLNPGARRSVFALLFLVQLSIYFVLNENFMMMLTLLPALFWQSNAAEQDLRGGRQSPAANAPA